MAWEYCGLEPNNKPLNECNIGIALEYAREQYGDILDRPNYAPPVEANKKDATKNLVRIFPVSKIKQSFLKIVIKLFKVKETSKSDDKYFSN